MSAYAEGYGRVIKTAGLYPLREKVAFNERLLSRLLRTLNEAPDINPRDILRQYNQGSLANTDPNLYLKVREWAHRFSPQGYNTAQPGLPRSETAQRFIEGLPDEIYRAYRDMVQRRTSQATDQAAEIMLSGQHDRRMFDIGTVPSADNPMFDPKNKGYRGYYSSSGIRNNFGDRHNLPHDAPRWITAYPEIAKIYAGRTSDLNVPGRAHYIDEIDLRRVPENRQGPWTPNVRVDTRGMAAEEALSLPMDAVSFSDLPHHEKVLDHGALEKALSRRYKLLPNNKWMKVMDLKT